MSWNFSLPTKIYFGTDKIKELPEIIKEFGYKKFRSEKDLVQALEKLYLETLLPLIEKGLCAAVYTQVSDVEEEINGFFTYDRKVLKVPVEKMAEINQKIEETANKIQ